MNPELCNNLQRALATKQTCTETYTHYDIYRWLMTMTNYSDKRQTLQYITSHVASETWMDVVF